MSHIERGLNPNICFGTQNNANLTSTIVTVPGLFFAPFCKRFHMDTPALISLKPLANLVQAVGIHILMLWEEVITMPKSSYTVS